MNKDLYYLETPNPQPFFNMTLLLYKPHFHDSASTPQPPFDEGHLVRNSGYLGSNKGLLEGAGVP